MPSSGLRVGVVFGGRSVEHDVSIITGLQACDVLDARHQVVPLYIDRHGRWFSGPTLRDIATYRSETLDAEPVLLDLGSGLLRPADGARDRAPEPRRRGLFGGGSSADAPAAGTRLDVVIPATHGTEGEDGALQGVLELADIPYAGPGLESAVLSMNKALTKTVLRAAGIPVLEDLTLRRGDYERDGVDAIVARVRSRFGLPVYVKPASLGSSVGVSRCADEAALVDALQLAFELDRLAIVEPAVEGGREIQCAVLGRPGQELRVSACDRPGSSDGFLSFEEKYLRGAKEGGSAKSAGMSAARHEIPARISDDETAAIQDLARRTFTALGLTGVTRVDFLIDDQNRIFVNEPNTIPGSLSFYMFEPAGVSFEELLDGLIDLALAEHAEKRRTTRTFESNLLAMRGKGAKG